MEQILYLNSTLKKWISEFRQSESGLKIQQQQKITFWKLKKNNIYKNQFKVKTFE